MSNGAERAPASGEPRDPEQIRRDIEQTREQLGDTVAALAAKADVKAQAKETLDNAKATARGRVEAVREAAQEKVGTVKGTAQEKAEGVKGAADEKLGEGTVDEWAAKAQSAVRESPVPPAALAAGVVGAGLLLFLLRRRRR